MTHRTTFFGSLAIALALGLPLKAQDAEVRRLAEAYVALPGMQGMFEALADPQIAFTRLEAMLPPQDQIPPEVRERIVTIVAEEMAKTAPAFEAATLEVSAALYTAEEFRAMLDFAATPLGSSILDKQAAFTMQLNERLAPAMQSAMIGVQQRLVAEFSQQ